MLAGYRTQAGFRVDQELAAGDDLITFVQARDDLDVVAEVGAGHHLARFEPARLPCAG